MPIHIVMLVLACAFLARLLVKAVTHGFRWGIIVHPLGYALVFLGLWLIASVIHEARPGKLDAEGRWLAHDRSRVVILWSRSALESRVSAPLRSYRPSSTGLHWPRSETEQRSSRPC